MYLIIVASVISMHFGAAIMDVTTGRIPNIYNLSWIMCGLMVNFMLGGVRALINGIGGMCVPLILLILFKFGVLGAGDIKLFCATGAFLGLDVLGIIIYSFILCGIFGVFVVVKKLIVMVGAGEFETFKRSVLGGERHYTKVAFSVFILGGYIWYLARGGVDLGV